MMCLLLILLTALGPVLSFGGAALPDGGELGHGTLVFSYPSRDGVEGNADCLRFRLGSDSTRQIYMNGMLRDDDVYARGDVLVRCKVRGGRVRDLDLSILAKGEERPEADQDLGPISASEAVDYFLKIAQGSDGDLAGAAILAAAVAEDADLAAPLLGLVRDRECAGEAREQAMFWLALLAGEKSASTLSAVIDDEDEDLELRRNAVFALTQFEEDTAFPMLMEIARNHPNPEVQRSAFIWIADYDRPEVLQLFEEILVEN